jgi:hypothetical protein
MQVHTEELEASYRIRMRFLKPTSDSFCGNRDLRWTFNSTVISAAVVVWFFEIILLNLWRSLFVNMYFRPLFLFADIAFPRFVYADISLETVALHTQMLHLHKNPRSVFFQNRTSLPMSDSFTWTVIQDNHYALMHVAIIYTLHKKSLGQLRQGEGEERKWDT